MSMWVRRTALAGLIVFGASAPLWAEDFRLVQLTTVLTIAIAASGLNLVSGFLGQVSMAHGAFLGLGAYTTGILVTRGEWSILATAPVAMLVCFVVGVVVGLPALRLSGLYLSLITLAFSVIFPGVIRRFESLTGGAAGLYGIRWRAPEWTGLRGRDGAHQWQYWASLTCLVLVVIVIANLRRSSVGRSWLSIRDNPIAAASMGVDIAVVKTVTFGLSAAFAGLAGTLYAGAIGILTPESFALALSIEMLAALFVGGAGGLAGPLLAGLAYVFLPYYTSDLGSGPISGVIFGVLLIVLMFVMPDGAAGFLHRAARRYSKGRATVPAPPTQVSTAPSTPMPVQE